MGAHTEYRPNEIAVTAGRAARALAFALICAGLAAIAAVGGYSYGRGDRTDLSALERQRTIAIGSAVTRAVARSRAGETVRAQRAIEAAVAAQRARDRDEANRLVLAEQQAGDRRAAAAFERGRVDAGGVSARASRPAD
jgi:hypothetical protein